MRFRISFPIFRRVWLSIYPRLPRWGKNRPGCWRGLLLLILFPCCEVCLLLSLFGGLLWPRP